MIALFDPKKGTAHVNGLLEALGITADLRGKEDAMANKGIEEIITIVSGRGGIAIPAHVTSNKGVIRDMKGNPRKRILLHDKLLALETRDVDKLDTRLEDLFEDEELVKVKQLAKYSASDNPNPSGNGHRLQTIGQKLLILQNGCDKS